MTSNWIAVSERLPDKYGDYNVTVKSWCFSQNKLIRQTNLLWFNADKNTWSYYCDGCSHTYKEDYFGKVIAWSAYVEQRPSSISNSLCHYGKTIKKAHPLRDRPC